jgi:hypothetical protein
MSNNMSKRGTYFIEVTDTFGDELNYCWIRRYAVRATTERGAMRVVGNHEGVFMNCDGYKWKFVNACIAAYVVEDVQDEDVCRYEKLN